jgi:GAF domain-containing protein
VQPVTAAGDLEEALEELSRFVVGEVPLDTLMAKIAEVAKQVIEPVAEASVTFTTPDEGSWTVASTGELATTLDEAQYEFGRGPCLDAASGGTPVLVSDLAGDDRWPDYGQLAAAAGAASSLSTPLPVQEHVVAALNLYSQEIAAFGDEHLEVAEAVAGRAAVAVANAVRYQSATRLAAELEAAMRSRATIEQAKGIIMATSNCGPQAAFEVLVRASQRENRKLRDVAQELVDRHSPGSA